jgi:hypothetical protein
MVIIAIVHCFCSEVRLASARLRKKIPNPLAGAFRELQQTNPSTGKQFWVVDWKEPFKRTADELYRALTNNLVSASPIAGLGSEPAYWNTAANVILRVKSEILQERLTAAN